MVVVGLLSASSITSWRAQPEAPKDAGSAAERPAMTASNRVGMVVHSTLEALDVQWFGALSSWIRGDFVCPGPAGGPSQRARCCGLGDPAGKAGRAAP